MTHVLFDFVNFSLKPLQYRASPVAVESHGKIVSVAFILIIQLQYVTTLTVCYKAYSVTDDGNITYVKPSGLNYCNTSEIVRHRDVCGHNYRRCRTHCCVNNLCNEEPTAGVSVGSTTSDTALFMAAGVLVAIQLVKT